MAEPESARPIGSQRAFATTHWSIVLAAGVAGGEDAQDALARLCETYWYPLTPTCGGEATPLRTLRT